MAESALTVEIVPIRTEEDRRLFRPVLVVLIEIILEMRGLSKGEIDDWMGRSWVDRDRIDNSGGRDLAGMEFLQACGGEG